MGAHAYLPPSGAAHWSRCAAWASLNAKYPQGDTQETREGTAAHEVAWSMWRGESPKLGALMLGETITAEMIEGAELICEAIREEISPLNANIETRVHCSQIHDDCYGTPDVFSSTTETIIVIDYKFGHRFVDETFNLQGLCYALGVAALNGKPLDYSRKVRFTIVQPRCYYAEKVRTHEYTFDEARELIELLRNMAVAAHAPDPVANPSFLCSLCSARHACGALQRGSYFAADFAQTESDRPLTNITAARELRTLEDCAMLLNARVEALRGQITGALVSGATDVPFYTLDRTKTQRRWALPDDDIILTGDLLGVDLRKPQSAVSVAKAEKLLDKSVISQYSCKPEGQMKLALINNKALDKAFKE